MESSQLLLEIAKKHTSGEIDSDEMGAMLSVMQGGPIIVEKPDELGKQRVFHTLDIAGNKLVAGKNYLLRGKKAKVLREEFGGGNFLDTYYRIFYIGSDLEENFEVVEVSYKGSVLDGSRVYQSEFKPIS